MLSKEGFAVVFTVAVIPLCHGFAVATPVIIEEIKLDIVILGFDKLCSRC
jgi:hypothetical protein